MFADAHLASLVGGPATRSTREDVPALRQASRDRAAARPAGPGMPVSDGVAGGVPVRTYRQQAGTVVFAHGGGFVVGDLDTHDAFCRRIAAATGRTVVAVGYRRAPEHPFPAAVDDVAAVVEHALGHGPVVVAGDSAGGFLAIQAALRFRGRLAGQLLVCPLADVTLDQPSVAEKDTGFVLDIPELRDWISWWAPAGAVNPLEADLTGLPPAVVVTVEHDPLRDGGNRYAARLREAGVPVRHREEAGLVHNFPTLAHVSPGSAAADQRFLADAAELVASRHDHQSYRNSC
ncbi:alpha/beta hydrolase [Dactylosporangium fulvum]|uniref:Alpha/beta hydrolase n=1 Tax=Dactylosporangium fulvum TaxID=53359 RepID=A0ABY5VRF5_9ACTN|nr:alpha/beta hydrolase [Dactylosporangium fulvum]UWP79381.1 alpha/beta hydrolase [Dactylosporangium fulvum]